MGYYVTLNDTNAVIPKDKLDEAYKILCDLNQRNDLKRGGSLPRKDVDGPHDRVWFSWMEWNYPETCKNAEEILGQVGLEFRSDEDGITFLGYDDKTGCEDVFLSALAPVLISSTEEDPFFEWRGEDGALWRQAFIAGKVAYQEPTITWS